MKIKKDQQKELKKIETCLQLVEQISSQLHLDLDDMTSLLNFPNLHEQRVKEAEQLNLSRQKVFELSKQSRKKESVKISAQGQHR